MKNILAVIVKGGKLLTINRNEQLVLPPMAVSSEKSTKEGMGPTKPPQLLYRLESPFLEVVFERSGLKYYGSMIDQLRVEANSYKVLPSGFSLYSLSDVQGLERYNGAFVWVKNPFHKDLSLGTRHVAQKLAEQGLISSL